MRTLLDQFDARLTAAIVRLPAWVRPIMVFATFVGGPVFTVGIGLLLAGIGFGRLNEPILQSGIVIVSTVGISVVLKLMLRRTRPLTYSVRGPFVTFSFPSGHTVGAIVAYGTLAYLSWSMGTFFGYAGAFLLVALTVIVGVSRVYLGAHYPSDVAAGWLLGTAGLAAILFIIEPKL